MNNSCPLVVFVVCVVVAIFFSSPLSAQTEYEAGEILVKFEPHVEEADINAFIASFGAEIISYDQYLNVYLLRLADGLAAGDLVDAMDQDPRTKYAELNHTGRGGNTLPNDTFVGEQWHISNTGQTEGVVDADIDAAEGWEVTTGSDSIVIAVLDTGFDLGHIEFEGRFLPGYDFVDDDDDPSSLHPHGPSVAGIAAANADNAFSVAGIDHHAMILPVRVLDDNNLGTTTNLASGLVYAANQGADVINMSLIRYPSGSRTLRDALEYAREAGAILVASAGNDGIGNADISGPGASSLTISVGATNHRDERWSGSATGAALDVVAPGWRVRTVSADDSIDNSDLFSGTSAAAPIVSGIASLLLSQNSELSHDQIRLILKESAEDQVGPEEEDAEGRDDFYGDGRVNLLAALTFAETPPDSTIDSPSDDISIVARDSVEFLGSCSDPLQTENLAYQWQFAGDVEAEDSDMEDPGELLLSTPGQLIVSFTCIDGFGKPDPTPDTVIVTVTNEPPDGSITSPSESLTVSQGTTLDFSGIGGDPDNHLPLTYAWDFGALRPESFDPNPGTVSFDDVGEFPVTFTVFDDLGRADPTPSSLTVTVTNEPPNGVIDSPTDEVTIVQGGSVEFAASGSDPDGHLPLQYRWSFAGNAPDSTDEDPGSILFDEVGTFDVTMTVVDSWGVADEEPAVLRVSVTNAPPDGRIATPASNTTISPGQSINFTGSGTDPDGHLPVSYRWDFGGAAPMSSVKDPGSITFDAVGVYTVSLSVADSRGVADPTSDTRVITVVEAARPSSGSGGGGGSLGYLGLLLGGIHLICRKISRRSVWPVAYPRFWGSGLQFLS